MTKLRTYNVDGEGHQLAVPLDGLWITCPTCLIEYHELSFGSIAHEKGHCKHDGKPAFGLNDSVSNVTEDRRLNIRPGGVSVGDGIRLAVVQ